MALSLFSPTPHAFSISSPFLPPISLKSSTVVIPFPLIVPNPIPRPKADTTRKKVPDSTIHSSSTRPKIVRCPSLDRQASRNSRLRFARKLRTLLLSKTRRFLPLRVLSRCRRYLGLPSSRPLLPMILRYPSLFRLFYSPCRSPSSSFSSLLSVSLTPAAAALADQEALFLSRIAGSLAEKLSRLLMLSPHRRVLLSKLSHLAPDLGLPANFRSTICCRHPDRFAVVHTSYGHALQLVKWDAALSSPLPPLPHSPVSDRIVDRPPRFRHLPFRLRRGLNLKRRHRDYLIRFHDLPEISPYGDHGPQTPEVAERRACAVVREVLAMTVEKRTLVDHLTHFRKDFGLPNRLRGMLVRHPEMFYVSVKGVRDSVFLVEAYDDEGRLVVEDELLAEREKLMELIREGKRMRRARRRGFDVDVDGEEEEKEEEEEEEEKDGFDDLFESGIGEDWEEFSDGGEDGDGDEEIEEFWVKKAAAAGVINGSGGEGMEIW
ncbi:protein WHAT'S THIS FACTOR 1, chloroplastic [Typha latifolia]|uniref:protein WHAT'S THIS FACTOR 1, chloroplastic n=1 Tax=Typha latifolia TaxID=4733 RepID=UPI003C2ADA9F